MPRLSTSLLQHARRIHPFLPLLLRSCRDLPSASNELRWLREHALATTFSLRSGSSPSPWRQRLYRFCRERSRGRPLQYILGNQPFGNVDILCRPETEAYVTHIANLLITELPNSSTKSATKVRIRRPFRILDLCTGSGCISLLLHAILSAHLPQLEILGVDISPKAVELAKQNLRHNIIQANLPPIAQQQIHFIYGDIFNNVNLIQGEWDMVISNPPYISPRDFGKTTSRSVRNFEPKLALVPQQGDATLKAAANASDSDLLNEDVFYPELLGIAERLRANIILVEVADIEQANRVTSLAAESSYWGCREIWRDWPDSHSSSEIIINEAPITVKGDGNGRSVVAFRGSLTDSVRTFLGS